MVGRRAFAALALAGALVVPVPAFASSVVLPGDPGASTYDTPKPKPKPTATPEATPRPTPKPVRKPKKTPKPTPRPARVWATAPALKVALAPMTESLTIGVTEDEATPLQMAIDSGYFRDAGFTEVALIDVPDPLAALAADDVQFAVADAVLAAEAQAADASLQAVAGYQNYAGIDDAYGGTVIVAAPGLVAEEPSTVSAFTRAYVQSLLQLARADRKADEPTNGAFAPFDGGFGARKVDGGWGQLDEYLTGQVGDTFDVQSFVADDTLNLAQIAAKRKLNPVGDLAGKPESRSITVGLPATTLAGSPIEQAQEKGYFKSAGFKSVATPDIEEPLLGVIQGDLDLAVIDTADALDGASQGLPLVALAGHRNFTADGSYGGDVVVTSQDFLDANGATATAFLTAYVRALQDLQNEGDNAAFAPFTGGFDASGPIAGWTELTAFADETIGDAAAVDELVDSGPLSRAQVWWGVPAELTPSVQPTGEPGASPEPSPSPEPTESGA